jgi:hypothetical protein
LSLFAISADVCERERSLFRLYLQSDSSDVPRIPAYEITAQVIYVKRAYVWAQFTVPKSKASKAPVPMHPVLAGFLLAWREKTPYAKDDSSRGSDLG